MSSDIAIANSPVSAATIFYTWVTCVVAYAAFRYLQYSIRFPTIKVDDESDSLTGVERASHEWRLSEWLRKTAEKFPKPYTIKMKENGTSIMLPPRYLNDVKSVKELSLTETTVQDNFSKYPGMDAFHAASSSPIFTQALRNNLTQALASITDHLSHETDTALEELLPRDGITWNETQIFPTILELVTRSSSVVFVGKDFEHLKEWQALSKAYTIDSITAMEALQPWPAVLQPVVHWFLPARRTIRAQVNQARVLLEPEIEARKKKRAEDIANGVHPKKSLDTVDWFLDCANGQPFDIVSAQLALALLSVFTTTATLVNVMLDLVANPDLIEPLRKEIREVLNEDDSIQRTALPKLKLMDSIMKESQRLHPLAQASTRRKVMQDLALSDGTVLPSGSHIFVGPNPEHDSAIWPDVWKFDGYRFLNKRRQPGDENKWQFTTITTEHLAFGYGKHACPGRFFVANEIKVALVHLIMGFDWKFLDGQGRPESIERGLDSAPNPEARLSYKRRVGVWR